MDFKIRAYWTEGPFARGRNRALIEPAFQVESDQIRYWEGEAFQGRLRSDPFGKDLPNAERRYGRLSKVRMDRRGRPVGARGTLASAKDKRKRSRPRRLR